MNSIHHTTQRMTLAESLEKQGQPVQLLPLESGLLLKRIKQGGHSGDFLKAAFISSYRPYEIFEHSLGEIMKLDAEAVRLFHEILHIRFTPNWDDAALYDLEQEIIQLNGGDA